MINVTLADILAEMRSHGRGKMEDAWYTPSAWRALCDRIEAAAKRERAEIEGQGDAAALRAALEQLCRMCSHNGHDFGIHAVRLLLDHLDMMKAVAQCALAAPPRNCDRFRTEEEAYTEFGKAGNAFGTDTAERLYRYARWLFAPEGGAR